MWSTAFEPGLICSKQWWQRRKTESRERFWNRRDVFLYNCGYVIKQVQLSNSRKLAHRKDDPLRLRKILLCFNYCKGTINYGCAHTWCPNTVARAPAQKKCYVQTLALQAPKYHLVPEYRDETSYPGTVFVPEFWYDCLEKGCVSHHCQAKIVLGPGAWKLSVNIALYWCQTW